MCRSFGDPPLDIEEIGSVPLHVGLGSKTSLSMAIGKALAVITRVPRSHVEVASLAKRGGTSGVGVHASEYGGFIIDSGHQYPDEKSSFGPSSQHLAGPPGVQGIYSGPEGWHIIHFRLGRIGLHGELERVFFSTHCPVPHDQTEAIERLVQTALIPALAEKSIYQLHYFLERIQCLGLKSAEWTLQDNKTKKLRDSWDSIRIRNGELSPICLSSMGPTLFMITRNPERELAILTGLGVSRAVVTKIANRGAEIRLGEEICPG
jgi:beta-ribofuranosylaminobenzene 5'-phosphate synthase